MSTFDFLEANDGEVSVLQKFGKSRRTVFPVTNSLIGFGILSDVVGDDSPFGFREGGVDENEEKEPGFHGVFIWSGVVLFDSLLERSGSIE